MDTDRALQSVNKTTKDLLKTTDSPHITLSMYPNAWIVGGWEKRPAPPPRINRSWFQRLKTWWGRKWHSE